MMKLAMLFRLTILPTMFTACVCAVASPLPQLGSPAPPAVLKAHVSGRLCSTGEGHREPCAQVRIHSDRITLAWDATTRKVTYLYSTTLITDDELATGNLGHIDASFPLVRFQTGFISSEWCDTDTELSGDALWCAVMKPADRHYGKVLGFVQSIYLIVPPDPDDLPVILKAKADRRIHHRSRIVRACR